jgi:segregation and condensation protein B
METADIKKIIEALLFTTDQPISENSIKNVLGDLVAGQSIEQMVKEIGEEYAQRKAPVELRFVAGGWQFSTGREFSPWIKKLYKEKTTLRLSNSALETLSIVAYKQPIARSEIEEIRGVEVSGVLETLLERKLVRIVGRKETIGRPLLYGTSQEFLRHFGLGHLSELPSLEEMNPPEEAAAVVPEETMEVATEETVEEAPKEEAMESSPVETAEEVPKEMENGSSPEEGNIPREQIEKEWCVPKNRLTQRRYSHRTT